MDEVQLKLDEKGDGAFYIMNGEEQVAEMIIKIKKDTLTVFHTEVLEKEEGKGLAKKLLTAMAAHARKYHLSVIPLCPYVHSQFKRHADDYLDIWLRNGPATF